MRQELRAMIANDGMTLRQEKTTTRQKTQRTGIECNRIDRCIEKWEAEAPGKT